MTSVSRLEKKNSEALCFPARVANKFGGCVSRLKRRRVRGYLGEASYCMSGWLKEPHRSGGSWGFISRRLSRALCGNNRRMFQGCGVRSLCRGDVSFKRGGEKHPCIGLGTRGLMWRGEVRCWWLMGLPKEEGWGGWWTGVLGSASSWPWALRWAISRAK